MRCRVTSWWVWLAGIVVLFGSGFLAVRLPHRRADVLRRRTAWSTARTAIETATVSRDALRTRLPEAEQLLARAESVAGRRGGASAADSATDLARRADRLWRAAADG